MTVAPPEVIAIALRRVARGIQASRQPDRSLVIRDLRVILSAVTNRLQTSGATDPAMSDLYEEGSLETRLQGFLDGFNSSFGTAFSVSDVKMEDRGVGYVAIEYPPSEAKGEPSIFKMDFDPSDTFSSFVQSVMKEIFGTELPQMLGDGGGGGEGDDFLGQQDEGQQDEGQQGQGQIPAQQDQVQEADQGE